MVRPAGSVKSLATKTNVSNGNSSRRTLRVKWAIGAAPSSLTVAGLIDDTGKPDVPKTDTRTRSRWLVSMIRCS